MEVIESITPSQYMALDNEGKADYTYNIVIGAYVRKVAPKRNVTALAVDQAAEYHSLGVSYDDVARNIRNFANVLRFLRNTADKPGGDDRYNLSYAMTLLTYEIDALQEDAAKQPELSLAPAAKNEATEEDDWV